jgi:hypothetical protein
MSERATPKRYVRAIASTEKAIVRAARAWWKWRHRTPQDGPWSQAEIDLKWVLEEHRLTCNGARRARLARRAP